jgi:hypothetical protein
LQAGLDALRPLCRETGKKAGKTGVTKKMPMVARFVIPALLVPAFLAAALPAAPAHAAVSFGPSLGATHSFAFESLTDPLTGLPVSGTDTLDAKLDLTLVSTDGFTFAFTYKLVNAASGSFSKARIAGFGFDVSADPSGASSTGKFGRAFSGEVVPGFVTDFCAMAGGSGCNANSGSGITSKDGPALGQLSLTYGQKQSMVSLSNVYVRWHDAQTKQPVPAVTITDFTDTEPAPEPAAWAMMIAGFGLVGVAIRRRRSAETAHGKAVRLTE